MKFHQLSIENFLTIKSASLDLADRGLHLIQGVNDHDSSASSNGAGKSSVVDAICWCLFGVTAREAKGDDVVNRGTGKNCRVSIEISNGSSRYLVRRHRKHSGGKNSLVVAAMTDAPGFVDLSKGTDTETQKVLEKLLGCSYEVFIAAVYSGQEAMPDLPRMKDRELKTLIEEAAGLQRIERAYELARERMNTAKSALNGILERKSLHASAKAKAEMALETVATAHVDWETARGARVAVVKEELDVAKATLKRAIAQRDIKTAQRDIATAWVADAEKKMASHRALESAAVAVEGLVRKAELAIDTGALKRLAAAVTEHQNRYDNAAEEIKKPCRTCGTELSTMTVEAFREHEAEHIERAKNQLETAKIAARSQMAKLLTLREQAEEARAAVPVITELVEDRARSQGFINEWDTLREAAVLAARAYNETEATLVLRTEEPNPHESAFAVLRKQMADAIASLAAAEEKAAECQKALDVSAAVVKVFGPAGVRAQILDTVTPYLNAQTADYLSALSDGNITATWTTLTKSAGGDLKEKFTIDVEHSKGGDSFKLLSGGEKRKVRLSCALALQDLVASRATQPIDLWLGDEIDDAMDPAGLERLMTILERRARERGTVIVISHSDLKDWCDNVTTVRKTDEFHSTVEGSLCL
jgi:DNA repair exonuclease SbcCD ATPase subunit